MNALDKAKENMGRSKMSAALANLIDWAAEAGQLIMQLKERVDLIEELTKANSKIIKQKEKKD